MVQTKEPTEKPQKIRYDETFSHFVKFSGVWHLDLNTKTAKLTLDQQQVAQVAQ